MAFRLCKFFGHRWRPATTLEFPFEGLICRRCPTTIKTEESNRTRLLHYRAKKIRAFQNMSPLEQAEFQTRHWRGRDKIFVRKDS